MALPLLVSMVSRPHLKLLSSGLEGKSAMARVMGTFAVLGAVTALSVAAVGMRPQEGNPSSRAALAAFDQRIAKYVELHRQLEARLPPLETSTDPERFIGHRESLAAAIKAARPGARQGDLIDSAAAPVFRRVIEQALYGLDVEGLLRELFEEHPKTWGYRVRVYASYPFWATREVPGILLQELPALPAELEYRVVDHDLAILDVDANLVLDVLRGAIAQRAKVNGRDY
jgi:hypothetical protein